MGKFKGNFPKFTDGLFLLSGSLKVKKTSLSEGKMKSWALLGIAFFFLFANPAVTASSSMATKQPTCSVAIDMNGETKMLPYLFRAGVFTFVTLPPTYIQAKLFSELKPGTIEIDLGREIFANSESISDILFQLSLLDDFLLEIKKNGGEIVFGFSRMPLWLSSNPSGKETAMAGDETLVSEVSPPKDYDKWAALIESLVRHFNQIGVKAKYKIGWEPDTPFWQGTEEDFFKLYKYAVIGAKRADPTSVIGGPGVSDLGPHWKKQFEAGTMLENFIEYCSQTTLPELGLKRLPLDFVAFHLFGGSPLSSYQVFSRLIRESLVKNGYSADTELYLGEWSDLPAPISMDREGHYLPSFIVANLVAMEKAGIKRQSFTSLMDQQASKDTQFGGGYGLFTRRYVTRPTFNTFRALSMLGNRQLGATSADPFIPVIASAKSDSELAVLVANYIPTHRVLVRSFLDELFLIGYKPQHLLRFFKDMQAIEEFLVRGDVSRLELPEKMKSDMMEIREKLMKLADKLESRSRDSTKIVLEFNGLKEGKYTVKQYLIDSRHANAFQLKDKIDEFIKVKTKQRKTTGEDLAAALSQKNYTEKDFELLGGFLKAEDKRGFRSKLSFDDRKKITKILRVAISRDEEMIASISSDINDWREVRLEPLTNRGWVTSDQPAFSFDLEPSAVSLLLIERQ